MSEKFILLDDDTFIVSPIIKEQLFKDNKVLMNVDIGNKNIYGNHIIKKNNKSYIKTWNIDSDLIWEVEIPNKLPCQSTWNTNSHTLRPFLKSNIEEFEKEYPEWFKFVSSHKKRFCFGPKTNDYSKFNLNGGCYNEVTDNAIYWFMMKKYNNIINSDIITNSVENFNDILIDLFNNNNFHILNINDSVIMPARQLAKLKDKNYYNNIYLEKRSKLLNILDKAYPITEECPC